MLSPQDGLIKHMDYLGSQFVGFKTSKEGTERYRAIDPSTGKELAPEFAVVLPSEVDRCVKRAVKAFEVYRKTTGAERAEFLSRIADEIEALGDPLIRRCSLETGLPEGRITGERGRTCAQLRLFAKVAEEGSWVDARIDTAIPDREPLPKPDIRRMLVAMGPVAIFGASNFPLAFSTAGGDTASALATGNTVIVKAHPAHPGTSEMIARAIIKAAVGTGMPDGVFSMVHGFEEVGRTLVRHEDVQAVGFTGSLKAGRALFDIANARSRPIPVFAEMGSINPVFVFPGAMKDAEDLAEKVVASVTMGCGQFCTNPGLIVGVQGDALDELIHHVSEKMAKTEPGVMLTPGIKDGFSKGAAALKEHADVSVEVEVPSKNGVAHAAGVVFSTTGSKFMEDPDLHAEVFGPSTLIVKCQSPEQMREVAQHLEGQLTATIWMGSKDASRAKKLAAILEKKAGRVLFNGFPTGVEVCPSMQHGGPYPASTDSRFTSVGTAALYRFVRPVSWQNAPAEMLPTELLDENPLRVWRLINGARTRKAL